MCIMNELRGSKIYIVLSIKEGEGFGFLQESIIISCSLNGHVLQTDPCGVRSSPVFDSELIWETDKKTLRSLRLQNVPIKINVNSVTEKKIGYLLLNLLSATPCASNKTTTVSHTWHRLLGLKPETKSSEPKLLLRLTVSDSDKPNKIVDEIKTPRSLPLSPSKFTIDSSKYRGTYLKAATDTDIRKSSDASTRKISDSDIRKIGDAGTNKICDIDIRKINDTDIGKICDTGIEKTSDSDIRNIIDTDIRGTSDTDIRKFGDIDIRKSNDSDIRKFSDIDIRKTNDSDTRKISDSDIRKINNSDIRKTSDSDIRKIVDMEFSKISKSGEKINKLESATGIIEVIKTNENLKHSGGEQEDECEKCDRSTKVQNIHNVTFQSHDTSLRDNISCEGLNKEDRKMTEHSSPDTSCMLSEAYSNKESSLGQPYGSDVLHGQGDTPERHRRQISGQLSPKTKEEIVRKTVNSLEKWKEKQQILYADKLQQSEKKLLQRLEKEWRHREAEQGRVIKECQALLRTLQQSMQEVTERSNQLSLKENKLRLAKDELEMLYMTKYHELNEASRRMEDDYNHQTKLQHLSLAQLESKIQSLEANNSLLETQLKAAEEEVEKMKRDQISKDEISKINQEKLCLEKQLETALKSKSFFKDQWVSAVREANILKLKYTTNISYPQSDPATYRFQELLHNEEEHLHLDNIALRKLKEDILNSERSESRFAEHGVGLREPSPRLDVLGSPSKKSVSYKSERSFI